MATQPQISAANRKYVSPSFTSLADPFYATIQAAINSITDASSTNAYAIFIYPGTYNEAVTLKSYVSIVGAGIDDVIIKGTGSSQAITGPAADSGSGQSYINNLTIDGNGQTALLLPDSNNSKTLFVFDVQILSTAQTSQSNPAIVINNAQSLSCFHLRCFEPKNPNDPNNPVQIFIYQYGIQVNGTGNLRMWQSYIYTNSYCLTHNSSQYSETYNSILTSFGPSCMQINSGVVNIYNSQTVGEILVSNSNTKVKHVDSFHDGHFSAINGATIWVSGMKWGQESGIDVIFFLSGGSKIIVSNSKAGVTAAWKPDYVVYVGTGCTFKAFNSEFTNSVVNGNSITGDAGVTVYLYYCTFSQDVTGVTASGDSKYVYNISSD